MRGATRGTRGQKGKQGLWGPGAFRDSQDPRESAVAEEIGDPRDLPDLWENGAYQGLPAYRDQMERLGLKVFFPTSCGSSSSFQPIGCYKGGLLVIHLNAAKI